ncbi:MAG: hypothetical protein HGA31_05855 [Candidatus Moranbacteria bacterium]|nr:hypothetical protein [Candidatus Moranbacteria bacterium]
MKSILGIRFIRDGFDEVRLNYPGLLKYPVKAGEQNTLFSCLHATNAGIVSGGELRLTLTDSFGTVLDAYTYQGDITGDMMGVKHDFTPKIAASTYTLKAELKKDGKTVETYETVYDCKDLDATLCPMNVPAAVTSATSGASSGKSLLMRSLYVVFVLIPVGLIAWFLMRRRKGFSIFVFILLGSSMVLTPYGAEAKSSVWNTSTNTLLYRRMILGEDFVASAPAFGGTLKVCVSGALVGTNAGTSTLRMYKGDTYQIYVYTGGSTDACDGTKVTKDAVYVPNSGGTVFSMDSGNEGKKRSITALSVGSANASVTYAGLTVPLVISVRAADEDRWPKALKNQNVSITYNARVIDAVSRRELCEGETVPVGSRVRFEAVPYKNTDISWFGTGMSYDTPFGYWKKDADPPNFECSTADEMTGIETQAGGLAGPTQIFIPFSVDFPNVSYRHEGTATLNCKNNNSECQVMSPGTIRSSVVFGNTFGQFYFRRIMHVASGYYKFLDGLCTGNDDPLSERKIGNYGTYFKPYYVNVPEISIPFGLTAVTVSAPPTAPIVTGPDSNLVSQSSEFSVNSTDPDGDTLRYGFDWNNDGSVEQWMPADGFVASGVSQTASYSWIDPGTVSFKVLAEDSKGSRSPWTEKTVQILSRYLTVCNVDSNGLESPADSFPLFIDASRSLKAHFGMNPGTCLGEDNTPNTTFTGSGSAISVTDPGAGPGAVAGMSDGTGTVTATDDSTGISDIAAVTVSTPCNSTYPDCHSNQYCPGEAPDVTNSCGSSKSCPGTKQCSTNWREVVPGN